MVEQVSVTMKEVKRMLQEFSDKQDYVDFLQKENEKLRKKLKGLLCDEAREEVNLAIRMNERVLIQRCRKRADFLKIIDENLTGAEFKVIQLRHIKGQQWKDVVRNMEMCRSNCFRLESEGMEKLRREWEKYLSEVEERGEE